jgi:hypothetical protein
MGEFVRFLPGRALHLLEGQRWPSLTGNPSPDWQPLRWRLGCEYGHSCISSRAAASAKVNSCTRNPDGDMSVNLRSLLASATTVTGSNARVCVRVGRELHRITVPSANPSCAASSETVAPAARRSEIHLDARSFKPSGKQRPWRLAMLFSSRRNLSASRCAMSVAPATTTALLPDHVRTGHGEMLSSRASAPSYCGAQDTFTFGH